MTVKLYQQPGCGTKAGVVAIIGKTRSSSRTNGIRLCNPQERVMEIL